MPDQATLETEVQRFWDARPCGVKNARAEVGTLEFFTEVEAHRYREEFHIPEVAEFNLHAGKRVLEVGCGLGTDGRQFVQGGAKYIGCDLSLQSVRLAQRGFELLELQGEFICTDAEHLPFADESFDVIYSHGVLHHTPDTDAAIAEVWRVLRPGGKAIIMLYARESFLYLIGAHVFGRLRLEWARRRLGQERFNAFVGLPRDFQGWLPEQVVINNSTDGLGNPLARLYTAGQLKTMFSAFRSVKLDKRYFPRRKIPVLGPLLPLEFASFLGKTVGNFWYVKAVK